MVSTQNKNYYHPLKFFQLLIQISRHSTSMKYVESVFRNAWEDKEIYIRYSSWYYNPNPNYSKNCPTIVSNEVSTPKNTLKPLNIM